jgi:hypothetical protein
VFGLTPEACASHIAADSPPDRIPIASQSPQTPDVVPRVATSPGTSVNDVLVAQDHHGLRPAQEGHNGAGIDTGQEQKGGGAMAGVVESGIPDAGVGQ